MGGPSAPRRRFLNGESLTYDCAVTIAGFVLLGLGLISYLAAFAQGPGPTMGDRPLQATLFTLATALMVAGFVLLVVI